ncbi:MAG TPA: RNA polymerase sigma factor [Myxococcota bacterium]|nr:RNA polymerase sigma factor [Myxococcota bacterium]
MPPLPSRARPPAVAAAALCTDAATDEALVHGIRESRQEDFNQLYDRYFQRIYSFVYLRVRNHADAEEIVQETFTAVFRSIDAFRGQSALLSWIYGIAKNTVNNHLRRAKLREQWVELSEPDSLAPAARDAGTPEDALSLRRYADAIRDRLGSVASWQAEVFVLRHVDNLPIREIARRTARSSDAIRSSLYRVKRLLVDASHPGASAAAP